MTKNNEYVFLVVDSSEGERSFEDPNFDADAYESDREVLIEMGMLSS